MPETELSPAHPADQLYVKLKGAIPADDVIVAQHVGGRYANLRKYFDQELISLVELVSVWGVFEWMLWDAFDRDYVVGVMCNSDGHHGRPGAEGAGMTEFGIRNGLTCALAEALTRDPIFEALKTRRTYGTTGARMLLDFSVNGALMGSVLDLNDPKLDIMSSCVGAAPLESLQLFRGRELIHDVRPPEFERLTGSNRIRVSWQGSRERGRQRRVTWDGEIRLEGAGITSAELFSFDVVADGIVAQTDTSIRFKSKTTGDRDGLDLTLTQAESGRLIFDSAAGAIEVDLAELTDDAPRQHFEFGGVDMQVIVERYPAELTQLQLDFSISIEQQDDRRTPYFVKVTQADGEMAWASPIYVKLK